MKILKTRNPMEESHARVHCPCCGRFSREWQENEGHGFWDGTETYCCRGCVEGTGCTCDEEKAGKRL